MRPTCNGHGQDQRVTAYARSQVYTADKARRDIGGAQWDIETGDGVVCSSAGRMFKGVELYMLGEGGLGWSERVA